MYICVNCNYKSECLRNYNRHLNSIRHIIKDELANIEKKSKIHKCDECEYETRFKENLNRHKRLKRENIDRLLVCELCKYKTLKQTLFQKHIESELHKENVTKQQNQTQSTQLVDTTNDTSKLFLMLMQAMSTQNKELIEQIMTKNQELMKQVLIENKELVIGMMNNGNFGNKTITKSSNASNSHNTYNVVQILDYYNTNMKDAMTIEKFNELLRPIQSGEFLKIGETKKTYKKILGNTYQTKLKDIPKKQRPLACYDSSKPSFIVNKDGEGWIIDKSNSELINSISETHKAVLECALKIMNDDEFMNKYGKQVFTTILKTKLDKDEQDEMVDDTINTISNKEDYKTIGQTQTQTAPAVANRNKINCV